MDVLTLLQFYERHNNQAGIATAKVVERYAKLAQRLGVHQVNDLNHSYPKETSLGSVPRRVINQPAPDSEQGTVKPMAEPLIMLAPKIKTDHRLVAFNPNARGDEAARRARAIAREMDDILVNGDRSNDPTTINGFAPRCTGDQLIEAGENGGDLTIAMVEDLVDQVIEQGGGKELVMNRPTYRMFVTLVRAAAGGATVADVTSEIPTYEGIPLIILGDKLNGRPVLDFDETQGSDDETCSMYCYAPGNSDVELSGVKLLAASNGIELIEEGIRDSFYIDVLEVAFGLAVYDDTAVARLKGIKKPAA